MSNITMQVTCPDCGKAFSVQADINPKMLAPQVRSKIQPAGSVLVYRITSDDMKSFIVAKARKYCPEAKIEVAPRYTEKKKRKDTDPHRSYASLRIAFSEHILDKGNQDLGWYGKIGDSADNVRIIPSMFQNIIQLYKYNPKDIEEWTKSYKNLEELEEALGMSEAYINDLRQYSRPQRITTNSGEHWIIFAAAAENVLKDMLTDYKTNVLPGRIQIVDVYPISKENVEFVVYLYPEEIQYTTNPHVMALLRGEEKAKK